MPDLENTLSHGTEVAVVHMTLPVKSYLKLKILIVRFADVAAFPPLL